MTTSLKSRATGVLAATALALGTLLASGPASAATAAPLIATPNGMVGVPQQILVRAGGSVGQSVTLQLTSGPAVQVVQTTIASNGFGNVTWTPAGAGPWTITGLAAIQGATTTITVAPMPVYTVIMAPNHMQQGAPSQIVAGTVAPIGTLAPTGSVTFSVPNGITLGTAPINGVYSSNVSYATLSWTPGFSGYLPVQATFVPASGGQLASTSPVGQPNISAGAAPLIARWPSVIYQGEPTVLQAVIASNQPAGVVSFSFTGGGGSGSMPIPAAGSASYQWTPAAAGVQTVTVQYSGANPGFSASMQQVINVLPPRPVDDITVTSPAQGAWSQGAPLTMTANATIPLTGVSQSGTTVLFSETGPCVINGNVLFAVGTGSCQVTAFSPGNAQIKPGSETYIVNVTAAPKPKPKPKPRPNRR